MKYIGQTGRTFLTRFQENLRNFKYGNGKSRFAQHLLDNKHTIGPMEDIMEILHIEKKGKIMNTLENFYICKETKIENRINDKSTIKQNILFDTVIRRNPGRGYPA